MRGLVESVGVLGVCLLSISCGKIDSKKLETGIAEHFKKETGQALDSVSCPSGHKLEKGDSFECTAKAGTTNLVYTVTQKDSKGNVEWQLRDGVVVSSKLEKLIVTELEKQTSVTPKKVDCGEPIRLSIPKSTFECTAIDPEDNPWRVGVTVTSTEGNVDFKVIGKAGATPPAPAPAPASPDGE